MLALVVVAFSPSVFMQLSWSFSEHGFRTGGTGFTSLISLLTTTIIVCFIALQMRGYIVFGTTQDSFRQALVSTLSNLNLKFEEALSSIQLPSVPAELQVAVDGWMGTAQLRIRNGGRPRSRLLADVVGGMNAYFNAAKVKTNMTSAVAYLILGILMSTMVVVMIATA